MQSVCALIAPEYARRVVDLRAAMSEDPAIGAIYDPPFVHFTLQLAEEYDWLGLEGALADFATRQKPFELRTVGVLAFTGKDTGITIAPYKDRALADFHAAVWETVSPFARGKIVPFYAPDRWVPHITIKRTGTDPERFGRAMARLAGEDVAWIMAVDNVSVQHDPGKNSLTHYQRLWFPLAGSPTRAVQLADTVDTNATILDCAAAGDGGVVLRIRPDEGEETEQRWNAPEGVRRMAAAASSTVHFPGARCRLDGTAVAEVVPATPAPVMVGHATLNDRP